MRVHVISLDRTPDRYAEFVSCNGHLRNLLRFSAVDGASIDREAVVRAGTVDPKIFSLYRPGALGCALSHIALWQAATEADEAITVCEDDAIFNRYFETAAPAVMDTLPPDWTLILWGWNFTPYVAFQIMPGALPCLVQSSDVEVRRSYREFQDQRFAPRPYRLIETFGTVCYSVSPGGARMLQQLCLPLREMTIYLGGQKRQVANVAIDVLLNAFYTRLNAYVSFPPLVLTRNENTNSTASRY